MGYIAFAAGTVILAVCLHSLLTKRPQPNPAHIIYSAQIPDPSVSGPEEEENDGNLDLKTTKIVIISAEQQDVQSSRSNSPPQDRAPKATSPRRGEQDEGSAPSLNLPTIERVQSHEMPPPPRVASAPNLTSVAAQARQRAAMLPPTSLPPYRVRSPPRLQPAASSLAPPRQGGFARPTGFSGSSLTPPPSTASSLRVPLQKVLSNTHMQPASSVSLSTSTQAPSKRSSKKIMLTPGHSPLDWAALTRSTSPTAPTKLRGQDATAHLGTFRLGRITPSQLKYQNGRKGKDAWTVYQGRVYNISAYLDFHPGGRDELMKGAGRSSDTLFVEVHPWVNWEGMLGNCLIGMLVSEDDVGAMDKDGAERDGNMNVLDEMD